MTSIQSKLKNPRNNFTAVRNIVALLVIYYHAYPLFLGRDFHDPISKAITPWLDLNLGGIAVGVFFAISGFLITRSFDQRQDFLAFCRARVLRIVPALLVCNLLSVFVLGALLTNLDLSDYFSQKLTFRYISQNTFLFDGILFRLPGVFSDNVFGPAVNGNLWTLVVEVRLYLIVGVAGLLGIFSNPKIGSAFYALLFIMTLFLLKPQVPGLFDGRPVNPCLFMLGGILYLQREKFALNLRILIALIIFWVLLSNELKLPMLIVWFGYFALLICLSSPSEKIAQSKFYQVLSTDISYGVYIYSFPVQQTIQHYLPEGNFTFKIILSFIFTILLGYLSMRLIEKPALRLKKTVS